MWFGVRVTGTQLLFVCVCVWGGHQRVGRCGGCCCGSCLDTPPHPPPPPAELQTQWLHMWASNPSFLPACVDQLAQTYLSKHALLARLYSCHPELPVLFKSFYPSAYVLLLQVVAPFASLGLSLFCKDKCAEERHIFLAA